MHRTVQFAEQLQLAGTFLTEASDQHARLSLILCDNVVELLAHERCEYRVLLDSSWYSGGKLSAADKRDAMGQKFAPKVNLLGRLGDLTPAERDFATRAHALRNECYHTAAAHEDVARAVAWEYHELACDLFERLKPGGYMIGGDVPCSAPTRRLLSEAGLMDGKFRSFESCLPKLIKGLRVTKPRQPRPFAQVLSEAGNRRFAELESTVNFLARDGLETDDMDAAIKEAFFLAQLDYAELRKDLDTQQQKGFQAFHQRLEAARAKFKSPVRFSTIQGWARRATELARIEDRALALVTYADLLRESEEADEVLDAAGRQLDAAIQHQIDVIRGK